jgi:hypothetical protein
VSVESPTAKLASLAFSAIVPQLNRSDEGMPSNMGKHTNFRSSRGEEGTYAIMKSIYSIQELIPSLSFSVVSRRTNEIRQVEFGGETCWPKRFSRWCSGCLKRRDARGHVAACSYAAAVTRRTVKKERSTFLVLNDIHRF